MAALTDQGAPLAVAAKGLGKHYRLGELHNLQQTVRRLVGRGRRVSHSGLEALAGVDFTVHRGQAMGLVGMNGSGKSTLLQILAGTTLPTRGTMHVWGKVLPLLAVGHGFHPELTGRENLTLFASSLGFSRRMVEDRLAAVTAFAEIERHMDTPVKRFSSGIVSRLSFATAVQFPADIYIFDEVLAVVDSEFQARCMAEIKRLHASQRTIFFVSHNREQMETVCEDVMWLDQGVVREIGPAAQVLDSYASEHGLAAGVN